MKKIFSLLLALTLLVSTMSVAFAAPADVTNEDQMEAVDVLMSLDIVDGYPDGTYQPGNTVTRAEMAKLIVTSLGYDKVASAQTSSFSDMSGHWAAGFVEVCVGLGIVNGYTDGTFKPDAVVSYNEAATMIVRALGYTDEALGGVWPTNYVTKAIDLDIFDDVSTVAGGANRGDLAVMLYNTLELTIGTVDFDGDYNPAVVRRVDTDNDGIADTNVYDTILERRDVVQVADFVIDGTEDTVVPLLPFVGVKCDVWKDDNGSGDIILLRADSEVLVGEWNGSDTFELTDGTEYTLESNVDANEDKNEDVARFENGTTSGAADFTTMADLPAGWVDTEVTISVDRSGKTIKEVYAVNLWTITESGEFDEQDGIDIEDDHELFGIAFEENDDEDIKPGSYRLDGVDSLDDIKDDDVVLVYKGLGNKIRRIAVSDETVTGTITRLSGSKISIDGTKYSRSDAVATAIPGVSANDETATLTLDYFGDWFKYDLEGGSADNFAIVLETDDGSTGLGGDDALLKAFLADGSDETFAMDAKDVDTDVDSVTAGVQDMIDDSSKAFYNAGGIDWTGTAQAGTIVRYNVNSDGEIDIVETFAAGANSSEGEDDRYVDNTAVLTDDITDAGYFEGKKIDEDAVIFVYDKALPGGGVAAIPAADLANDDNWTISSTDNIIGDDNVIAEYIFDVSDNKIIAMIIYGADDADDVFAVLEGHASNNSSADYEVDVRITGEEETILSTINKATYDAYIATSASALYLVDYNAAGEIEAFVEVTAPYADVDWSKTVLDSSFDNSTTATDIEVNSNNVLTNGADGSVYALDADVIVYKYVKANDFDLKDVRNLDDVGVNDITLYDVDGDLVYDYVIYE